MGSCLCKKKPKSQEEQESRPQRNARNPRPIRQRGDDDNGQLRTEMEHSSSVNDPAVDVNHLIMETLSVIRDLVNNDQEPPGSLLKLNIIADKEDGWQMVVRCLIETVPHDDALGPAVITLFLDESPLPAREAVSRLLFRLDLSSTFHSHSCGWHRNVCIVLGSLAEKMAGASCSSICTPSTMNYLLDNLHYNRPAEVILFSLIALEKLAQTTENRLTILRLLNEEQHNPLEMLERWLEDPVAMSNPVKMQVAFCAQWSLDNIFVNDSRTYSCMVTDISHINAMLNHADVSEYLKIGPDGLNARCDVSSFESVRCTFEVPQDRNQAWYYEALVLTAGVMQIGFATKKSRFLNHEGYGIGDDEHSIAYDGCRKLVWHAAKGHKHDPRSWRAGDTVGCLLDIRDRRIIFSLNGMPISVSSDSFFSRLSPTDGIFAAASFMSFQQCIFNFGASPFRYPPRIPFISFNEGGAKLTQEEKTILPRRRRMELLARDPLVEDACTICCSRRADTITKPCMHGGLCHECALQVEVCPFCRMPVEIRVSATSMGEEIRVQSTV